MTDFDPELIHEALAGIEPQTKDELWHYCKSVLQLKCEQCAGTGRYRTIRGEQDCLWCAGAGRSGFHFSRKAICEGHVAPLDIFWSLFSGELRDALIIGNRSGGKTLMLALLEYLLMRFRRYSISHMGAVEKQANRARDHFHHIASEPPWSDPLGGRSLGMEEVKFEEGGKIEWLAGTLKQASGPHPELSVLDEVDEALYEVRSRFLKTPYGPRAQFIEASTHYIQLGTISRILKEFPNLPVRRFCIWESLRNCEYDCDRMPLSDGTIGRCPLYETEDIQADGSVRILPLCGGRIARECDGHIPVPSFAALWQKSDQYTRRVEFLCQKPDMPVGGRAYWGYSDEVATGNVLNFDPEVQPDVALEWTMDFNPGIGMRMCSMLIQQAPPQYGQEWWIIDAIILGTSATEETVRELLRRYGPGGSRLTGSAQETGHKGGLWIFGDASGDSRTSITGETNYGCICRMLGNSPGFRLMVPNANPGLVDRLNLTNRMLYDLQGGGGKRWIKVAPRVVDVRRELEIMPLGADRKKDKSDRVQKQLGLSHLGDSLEYWVSARFPNGPGFDGSNTSAGVSLGGARGSAGIGGRRSAADSPFRG